jgi:Spy/CpxP family protein refolding chaperone
MGMKKLTTALLFTAALVCAQPQNGQNPPDPAAMAQREVQFLTKRLGLSAAQQAQAVTIFTAQFTADAATHASLKTERTSLTSAIQTNNSGAIDQIATQIGTLTTQLTSSDAKAQAAFYAILTTSQQTTYNEHPNRGGGPGPRGRGFGHGGPQ